MIFPVTKIKQTLHWPRAGRELRPPRPQRRPPPGRGTRASRRRPRRRGAAAAAAEDSASVNRSRGPCWPSSRLGHVGLSGAELCPAAWNRLRNVLEGCSHSHRKGHSQEQGAHRLGRLCPPLWSPDLASAAPTARQAPAHTSFKVERRAGDPVG